jgi:hypothetical protein
MQEVAQYLASLSGKAVVINIFAGHADRSLSQTQLAELLDKLLAAIRGSRLFCSITGARSASRCRRRW